MKRLSLILLILVLAAPGYSADGDPLLAPGSTGITTLGTVTSGTWSATAIGTTKGGTNLTSYAAGDILYASAINVLSALTKGTAYYSLTMNSGGTLPSWQASPTSVMTTTGDLLYASSANTLARLAVGAEGTLLRAGASAPAYTTLTMPATIAAGSVFAANSSNVLTAINSTSGTKYLKNAAGTISWDTVTAGAAGNDTEIMYNDGGTLAGDGDLTWTKATNKLYVSNGQGVFSYPVANPAFQATGALQSFTQKTAGENGMLAVALDYYPADSGGVAPNGDDVAVRAMIDYPTYGYTMSDGGAAFAIHILTRGPTASTGSRQLVGAEINVEEKEADAGYMEALTGKTSVILQLVPNYVNPSYNVNFGAIIRSQNANAKTHVGFATELDSIANDGTAVLLRGGSAAVIPIYAIKVSDKFDYGLDLTAGTYSTAQIHATSFTLGTTGIITEATWQGVAVATGYGGTGAANAADARTNLGLAIGTNVQAYDAQLADIAALAVTDGNFIVGDGANWVAESGATARTSIGLGTTNDVYFKTVSAYAGSGNYVKMTGGWTVYNDGTGSQAPKGITGSGNPTFLGYITFYVDSTAVYVPVYSAIQ